MINDDHVVGEFFGFFEIVSGEQHGHAAVAKISDHFANQLAASGIDPGSGLIEERNIGSSNQCERERQSLLFAAGHRTPCRGSMIGQPHELEQFIGVKGVVVVRRKEM